MLSREDLKEFSDLITSITAIYTKEMLTSDEVAKYLGISKSYLYKLTMRGEIPHYKPIGKLCYFNRKEIESWIQGKELAAEEEETPEPKKIQAKADQRYVLESLFPEHKESEGEKTKRLLHTIANKMSQHLRDIFTEEEFQCFDAWSNAWLEKQGEQKPADKVEPFKVGDWVMNKSGKAFSNGSISARVQRIEGHKVWFEHGTYADEWVLKKITD